MRLSFFMLFLAAVMICVPAHAEYYQYTDQNGNLHYTDNISEVPETQRPNVATHQSVEGQSDSNQESDQASPEALTEEPGEAQGDTEDQSNIQENIEGKTPEDQGNIETQPADEQQGAATDQSIVEEQGETENQTLGEDQAPTDDQSATGDQTTDEQTVTGDQTTTDDQNAAEGQAEKTPKGPAWVKQMRQKQQELDARKTALGQQFNAIQEEKSQLGEPPSNDAPAAEKDEYINRSNALNDKIVQYQNDYHGFEKDVDAFNAQVAPSRKK